MAGKKLLVADDSLTIQKVIRLALSQEGYEIHAVADGNDAIQQISLFRPDLVLIDISLPGKSAFEVKREINTLDDLAEVRFILMSSAFEKVDEALADEVEFHGRLIKPFDPAHLRQTLIDALAQVHAKRMEKTTFLPSLSEPPAFEAGTGSLGFSPPPLPTPDEASGFSISENFLQVSPPPPISSGDTEFIERPIRPEELPPLPSEPLERVSSLWEPDPASTQSSEFSPPPLDETSEHELPPIMTMPPSPPQAMKSSTNRPDEDIKQLTESTFEMADQLSSFTAPSIPQNPSPFDLGGLGSESIEGELPPLPDFDFGDEFSPDQTQVTPPTPPVVSEDKPPEILQPSPTLSPLRTEELEEMIRQEVRTLLEKMTQKAIPELAEKIIKQEIHRLLSESDSK